MERSPSQPYGGIEIRCPRMGGQVTFEYCRMEGGALPCTRALSCWQQYFDADAFFRNALAPEDFVRAFGASPPPKLVTLVELIEQARKVLPERQDT